MSLCIYLKLPRDIGVLDEKGYLQIVNRIKDIIIRGGQKINPNEIEEVLHSHPGIQAAQVVGVPDVRLGEVVCAWIRRKPESQVSEQELKIHCQDKVGCFYFQIHSRIGNYI